MQWDDVRILLALFRARTLHDAGARLGLDASTISRRVAGLERKLGARLFVRTRDGLRPTAAAERLRPHAEHMELDATALTQAATAAENRASGLVRLATMEVLATFLVREGLLGLRKEHPKLVIELHGGNRPVDLMRGEADIALRVLPLRHATLRVRRVGRSGVGLFAAPEYLRARGRLRSPRALSGHDVLVPAGELARLPEARWLTSRVGVHVVFRTSSMPALVAACAAGLGLAPLPLALGDQEPALERALVVEEVPDKSLWLVTPSDGCNAAVRIVADRVAAVCARAFATPR